MTQLVSPEVQKILDQISVKLDAACAQPIFGGPEFTIEQVRKIAEIRVSCYRKIYPNWQFEVAEIDGQNVTINATPPAGHIEVRLEIA